MGENILNYDQIFRALLIALEFGCAIAVGYSACFWWVHVQNKRQDKEAEYLQSKIDEQLNG